MSDKPKVWELLGEIDAKMAALTAERDAATAQLAAARELLEELFTETGYKKSYTAKDGGLHPGATSTVADVWHFLYPEGKQP